MGTKKNEIKKLINYHISVIRNKRTIKPVLENILEKFRSLKSKKEPPQNIPNDNRRIAITVLGRYEKDKGFVISEFWGDSEYGFLVRSKDRKMQMLSWSELED